MKKLTVLLVAFLAITSLDWFTFSEVSAAELNFSVEPIIPENQRDKKKTYFDLLVKPASTQIIAVNLRNDTENEVIVEPEIHSAITNLNGVVEYGKENQNKDETLKYDLRNLVKVEKEIKIPSKTAVKVSFTIDVPEEQFDGILAGGITFKEKEAEAGNKENSNSKGLSIENRYAYVVGLVLNETNTKLESELRLNKITPSQINARNVINVNLQNPVSKYLNRLKVEAKVSKKGSNKPIITSKKDKMQMAPNSNFYYPISLEGQPLKAGNYTLEIVAVSNDDKWNWKKDFTIKAEDAKKLNETDVTIKKDYTWIVYLVGLILLIIVFFLLFLVRKNKKRREKEEARRIKNKRKRRKKN
ncbi:MAG: DUF3324 domain-containing protein [Carnobacterium sp.]|uniref:DUF916 and DUF3324 domain-containing protein n=3 Tax=Carnobacterium sp. TaxID=48221 RepID=UPI002FC71415